MSGSGSAGSPALTIGEALARLVAFGTTIYLARTLGPDTYGVVAVAAGVMLYLTQVADSGVELAGMTEASTGADGATAVARGAILHRLAIAGALMLLLWPAGWLAMPQPDGRVLALYTLGLPVAALSVRWVYLGLQRPGSVAVSRILGDVATAGATLALVHGAGDVYWVPLAATFGLAVAALWLLAGTRRLGVDLRAPGDRLRAAAMLARGRRLALFLLLGLVLYNIDLLLLRALKGDADSGRYAAAYVLISFSANLVIGYTLTVLPALAREREPTAATAGIYATGLVTAWMATLPVAIGGVLVAPAVIQVLFGRAYADGASALAVLVLSVPISGVREVAVAALLARQREPALLRVNALAAAANITLNLALIPPFGLVGAAWATVATEVVRTWLAMTAARRAVPGRLPVTGLGRVLAAGLGMGAAIAVSGTSGTLLAIGVGGVAYPVLLGLFGAVRVGGPQRFHVST
ncbi:MAG: polysaccharide biosynthesis C-terminal domain-containing protein [Vicinamibacterales bacterium]